MPAESEETTTVPGNLLSKGCKWPGCGCSCRTRQACHAGACGAGTNRCRVWVQVRAMQCRILAATSWQLTRDDTLAERLYSDLSTLPEPQKLGPLSAKLLRGSRHHGLPGPMGGYDMIIVKACVTL